ncbi:MAG: hypothetical protein AAGA30_11455 [Planctomycetota bacterium]
MNLKIVHLSLTCILFLALAIAAPAVAQPATQPELILIVNPSQLLGRGLMRSWRRLDRNYQGRRIEAQPYSKINFEIHPQPSNEGALAELYLEGVSIGETKNTKGSTSIYSDAVTKFHAKQHIYASEFGIDISEPDLRIQSSQSFNRSKSKNPFAPAIAKRIYTRFPREIEAKSKQFAEQEIRRQLQQTVDDTLRMGTDLLTQAWQRFPWIGQQAWSLSSTDQHVIAVLNGQYRIPPWPERSNHAANVIVNSDFLEKFAFENLSNKSFQGEQINSFFRRLAFKSEIDRQPRKPWSVGFQATPVTLNLDNQSVQIRLYISYFETQGRRLGAFSVSVNYQLKTEGEILLRRVGPLFLEGEAFQGRNQFLKSIVRQKVETQLPEAIRLNDLLDARFTEGLDLELRIANIKLDDQYANIQIDK